jgi:tryptophan 2,3-dioxygenase
VSNTELADMPTNKDFTPEIIEKLNLLQDKYSAAGQDLSSYLDGLLYADFLTYWDYINLDTLLSLQQPITPFPDEEVFIIYHQITELYFKLSLHEFNRISEAETANEITPAFLLERIRRINRYFEALTSSFDIMIEGMDHGEFLKFRMSLLPASGFQSAQYRKIELCSTSLDRIAHKDLREKYDGHSKETIPEIMQHLYWREGAVEMKTGKKTLTLKQFENKYDGEFFELAERSYNSNIRSLAGGLVFNKKDSSLKEELRLAMRWLDVNVNINWTLAHYKSAVRYLQKDPADIAATGGTNWQKYLPPRFQKRVFFPELWSEEELDNWGKGWVKRELFGLK